MPIKFLFLGGGYFGFLGGGGDFIFMGARIFLSLNLFSFFFGGLRETDQNVASECQLFKPSCQVLSRAGEFSLIHAESGLRATRRKRSTELILIS